MSRRLHTLEEIAAAGADSAKDRVLSEDELDRIAVILAPIAKQITQRPVEEKEPAA